MAKSDTLFWVASPELAAHQILKAIEKKRPVAYVTRRWRLVAAGISLLPDWLYHRVV